VKMLLGDRSEGVVHSSDHMLGLDVLELIDALEERQHELERQLREERGGLSFAPECEDLFESAPCGGLILDPVGVVTRCNRRGAKLIGMDPSRIEGRAFSAFMTPEATAEWLAVLDGTPEADETQSLILELVHEGGASSWVIVDLAAERTESGEVRRWLVAFSDITEQKNAERVLRNNASHAMAMLRAIPDPVFCMSSRGERIGPEAEPGAPALQRGNSPHCWHDGEELPRELIESIAARIGSGLKSDVLHTFECRTTVGGQGVRDYEVRMVADETGQVTAIARDITAENRLERLLREAKRQWEGTFDAISDWVCIVDRNQKIIRSNAAVSRFFGVSAAEAVGRRCYEFVHHSDVSITDCPAQKAFQSGSREELEFQAEDGRWLQVTVDPIEGACECGELLVHIVKDITRRKRTEEERERLEVQNRQLQKAESLRRMAGAVAHHFNNLLAAIMGNLELVLDGLSDNPEIRQSVLQSMRASHRAAEIIRLMLASLGQTTGKRARLDLARVVQDDVPLLEALTPQNVSLRVSLPPYSPIIQGDFASIRQVLANLVANAMEAAEDRGGEVTVSVQVVKASEVQGLPFFPMGSAPTENGCACLSVADNGCGMDESVREKIFDPFFSTKLMGRGMGLAVVLGLVSAHGGAISVESSPGCGSTFKVFFPLHALEADKAWEDASRSAAPVEKGERVLVVDDEAMVRDMLTLLLRRKFAYEVVATASGQEAVAALREHGKGICLVVLDLCMPGMDGWETLEALRALRPDIPIILSSGYDEALAMKSGCGEQPQVFLHKPYRAADLEAAIEKALGGRTH
jgi:PAS domain S-box-containing protein